MTKKPPVDETAVAAPTGKTSGPTRRSLLGAFAISGVALTDPAVSSSAKATAGDAPPPVAGSTPNSMIDTVVVIYAENRSFNNLFANFPGLGSPLAEVAPDRYQQKDRDGRVLVTLPNVWGGVVPDRQTVQHHEYWIGEADSPVLPNKPFALTTAQGDPLPHGVVTRDLCHLFYHNQMQINGGLNDSFAAWSDSGGLTMGHYADTPVNLRLWRLARDYTLCDNFFMGAFGGSFLNHQYLVAAQPPIYPNADRSPAKTLIADVEGDDPKGARLKPLANSPASAHDGPPRFGPNALTPDFWAVNTMGPPYSPGLTADPADPTRADPSDPRTLPPQSHSTIGDRLSAKGIDWAWYAGGWQAALDGRGAVQTLAGGKADFSLRPNFQQHHQPLNYFLSLAPGTAARAHHLRDAGVGDSPRTNRFMAAAASGQLPPVSFYKPEGDLNMHAGYSDVEAGDRHIARTVDVLQNGPQWSKMLIIITFDENGGWWDHVAPPKGDRWGPGSRIPAILVSPWVRKGHVDHTLYDTGSIARFIIRRFNLETLPGLTERDTAMLAQGGAQPGDLTAALDPTL